MSSFLNNFISLSSETYGNNWYDEETKTFYICKIKLSSVDIEDYIADCFIINLLKYNVQKDILSTILTETIESPIVVNSIQDSTTLTYNADTHIFNLSFICNSFDLFSVDIKNIKDATYISNVTMFKNDIAV